MECIPCKPIFENERFIKANASIQLTIVYLIYYWSENKYRAWPLDNRLQIYAPISAKSWYRYSDIILSLFQEISEDILKIKMRHKRQTEPATIASLKSRAQRKLKRQEKVSLSHQEPYAPIIPPLSPLEEKNSRDIYPAAHSQPITPEPLTILEMLRRGMYNNPPKQNITKLKPSTGTLTDR